MDNRRMIEVIASDLVKPDQAEAVVALLDEYASSKMGGGKGLSEFARDNLIEKLSARTDVVVLLAYHQSTAVGLMIGFEGFSTFACKPLLNIHDVIVREAYRRQGVASQLFTYMQNLALQRGYCKLTLEVLEGNTVAMSAYEKLGFIAYELDTSTGKALFMEKLL